MNKEYIYIDGKVIVKDENGEKEPIDYYDSIDEVLVLENVIEKLQEEKNRLDKKYNILKNAKKRFKQNIFIIVSGTLAAILLFIPIFYSLFPDNNVNIVNTVFGPMSQTLLSILATAIPTSFVPMAMILFSYFDYKSDSKEKNAIEAKLNQITKMLEEETLELEKIKNNTKVTDEKIEGEFRVVPVNDKDALLQLKDILNLYYDCGYNEKKYYKYYQNGNLSEKLSKHYTEIGIELANEYFEEKEKQLIKK